MVTGQNFFTGQGMQTLFVIFVAFTAVAVTIQALILLGLFLAVRKSLKTVETEVERLRTTATPLISQTKDFVSRLSPKLDSAATDLSAMTRTLRSQMVEFQASTSEILDRVHRQTGRVDNMFSGALDRVDHASSVVGDAISVPLRQLAGVTAFAKAALASLRAGNARPDSPPRPRSATGKI
jgi:ABC-type transporter Mla subunit MlaD